MGKDSFWTLWPNIINDNCIKMPLGKSVKKNIKELLRDNKRKGKAMGANGKKRPMKQIIAIAHGVSRKKAR